ncbi:MAG: tRNA (guanosine(37)-N1)-methyltransferase TrmD [Proteobacteria bacterium]|jgi:tRNA (guanine37-N1)-methyltransferase|nr:tRNA (guanosine(37)-N1)-methyltransferase TrmD [Pseudomonadota bacterium]MDA1300629.1 tRNA (guanosine(37)-N1)-methyltransferase TrmD [Pseudomonadota bacterium]
MRFAVVSLFPEMFVAVSEFGVSGRAVARGLVELNHFNPRDFTRDRHRTVDDRPYGGGPGMLMKVEPLRKAIAAARNAVDAGAMVIYLSPQGRPLDQAILREIAATTSLILVAGRYEGIDERLIQREVDMELSIGDYVLSGGELAAMVVIDGVTRLLPGALGDETSATLDSFSEGLLDYPQYTRPELLAPDLESGGDGMAVPAVLLSGDHGAIARWRRKQSLGRTYDRRPDLIAAQTLDDESERLLDEYLQERPAGGEDDRGAT